VDVDCVPDHVWPVGVGYAALSFYGYGEFIDHADGPFGDSVQIMIVGGAVLVVEAAFFPDFGEGVRDEPSLVIGAETTDFGPGEGSSFVVDFDADGGVELRHDSEGG